MILLENAARLKQGGELAFGRLDDLAFVLHAVLGVADRPVFTVRVVHGVALVTVDHGQAAFAESPLVVAPRELPVVAGEGHAVRGIAVEHGQNSLSVGHVTESTGS